MKTFLIAAIIACLLYPASGFAGRCTGSANCGACKNCSSCKHCSKQGGSCGVCGGGQTGNNTKYERRQHADAYSHTNSVPDAPTYSSPRNNEPYNTTTKDDSSPTWLWVVAGFVLFYLLGRREGRK